MANALIKHGGDNLIDGLILGALAGILIAVGDFSGTSWLSWVTSIRDSIWNAIAPAGVNPGWLNWAETNAKVIFFGGIGVILGWIIDRV